jgi:hypothetical protein
LKFRRSALALPLVLGALMLTGAAPEFQRPSMTRARMEAALEGESRFLFIYGTQRPADTAVLRERASSVARRLFGRDGASAQADRDVPAESIATHPIVLIGTPAENSWTRRLAPALPVTFTDHGFRWFGRDYERAGDVLHLVYPNPYAPQRFLLLFAANSPESAPEQGGLLFGDEDWHIERNGELLRSGRFAQDGGAPWRYDASFDHDRQLERARFAAELRRWPARGVTLQAPPSMTRAASWALLAGELLARLDAMGLTAGGTSKPRVILYRSLAEKGHLTRATRPEHLADSLEADVAPTARSADPDFWSVAALRLVQRGAAPDAPYLEPAAAWLADRWGGESLELAVARLYFARLLPTAREAAIRNERWRSPLLFTPARAILMRAVYECAGVRRTQALAYMLGSSPPANLDDACRGAGLAPVSVERRYAVLADSLGRVGQRGLTGETVRMWRPADGFARGVCVAHAVSLEGGYLSPACARQLDTLSHMGANWVSLSPVGYLPSPRTPQIEPSADGGADEENDEAVAEAAAHARTAGLRVMLAPHLWTRGWTGSLEFGAAGWPKFFEQYRAVMLHYAVLAQREGIDALVVGHDLSSAALGYPDRWRALIGEVRRVYSGSVIYSANSDHEVEQVSFWDACDMIGVSFYYPLATKPGASRQDLIASASRALGTLAALSRKTGRPVLITEAGYPASASAAQKPWDEQRGAPIDVAAQRDCYEALFAAIDAPDWLAGVFVWKWSSSGASGGDSESSYSPQGRPAEAELERAFTGWRGRPVRPPRSVTGR